jgi:hypothetical protein
VWKEGQCMGTGGEKRRSREKPQQNLEENYLCNSAD